MQGQNQASSGPKLSRIVMPLIRLLNTSGELSWSDREEIADAIRAALRTHESMKAEQNHLLGGLAAAAGQQISSAQGSFAQQRQSL